MVFIMYYEFVLTLDGSGCVQENMFTLRFWSFVQVGGGRGRRGRRIRTRGECGENLAELSKYLDGGCVVIVGYCADY
jgi:hypothetical protein